MATTDHYLRVVFIGFLVAVAVAASCDIDESARVRRYADGQSGGGWGWRSGGRSNVPEGQVKGTTAPMWTNRDTKTTPRNKQMPTGGGKSVQGWPAPTGAGKPVQGRPAAAGGGNSAQGRSAPPGGGKSAQGWPAPTGGGKPAQRPPAPAGGGKSVQGRTVPPGGGKSAQGWPAPAGGGGGKSGDRWPQNTGKDDYDYPDNWQQWDEQDDFGNKGTSEPTEGNLNEILRGTPGMDFPNYATVPETGFDCNEQSSRGYYGDVEAECQVFHICQPEGRKDSFLCPLGTIFNQKYFVCDWWFNVNCSDTPSYYALNSDVYKVAEPMDDDSPNIPETSKPWNAQGVNKGGSPVDNWRGPAGGQGKSVDSWGNSVGFQGKSAGGQGSPVGKQGKSMATWKGSVSTQGKPVDGWTDGQSPPLKATGGSSQSEGSSIGWTQTNSWRGSSVTKGDSSVTWNRSGTNPKGMNGGSVGQDGGKADIGNRWKQTDVGQKGYDGGLNIHQGDADNVWFGFGGVLSKPQGNQGGSESSDKSNKGGFGNGLGGFGTRRKSTNRPLTTALPDTWKTKFDTDTVKKQGTAGKKGTVKKGSAADQGKRTDVSVGNSNEPAKRLNSASQVGVRDSKPKSATGRPGPHGDWVQIGGTMDGGKKGLVKKSVGNAQVVAVDAKLAMGTVSSSGESNGPKWGSWTDLQKSSIADTKERSDSQEKVAMRGIAMVVNKAPIKDASKTAWGQVNGNARRGGNGSQQKPNAGWKDNVKNKESSEEDHNVRLSRRSGGVIAKTSDATSAGSRWNGSKSGTSSSQHSGSWGMKKDWNMGINSIPEDTNWR